LEQRLANASIEGIIIQYIVNRLYDLFICINNFRLHFTNAQIVQVKASLFDQYL
jgi:hypothetical protein